MKRPTKFPGDYTGWSVEEMREWLAELRAWYKIEKKSEILDEIQALTILIQSED